MPSHPSRALLAASLAVPLVLLGACADAFAPSGAAPSSAAADAGQPDAGFPRTVTTCGFTSTLESPPERVVTIKSAMTETVLALGAADRLVGHAFPDGPVPDELADDAAGLTLLAERVPSAEVVLEAEPDLVLAGWESALTAESGGDRATLERLGVATWVPPSACEDPAHRPTPLTFDDVLAEIEEVGALLDRREEAAALVAEQRELLATVVPDDRGLTALWYSSGTDVPYVGAGSGAPQMIMDAIGLENVAAGVDDRWTSFSWEQVAEDDPDVVVLVDSTWNSAEQKRELLATSPATRELSAVRAERYLVVPFPATEPGVRSVSAAVDLAGQLAAIEVG